MYAGFKSEIFKVFEFSELRKCPSPVKELGTEWLAFHKLWQATQEVN